MFDLVCILKILFKISYYYSAHDDKYGLAIIHLDGLANIHDKKKTVWLLSTIHMKVWSLSIVLRMNGLAVISCMFLC